MKKKTVLLIYSRLSLNDARIEFMPFALNFIKCLSGEVSQVDIYVAESKNARYKSILPKNVQVNFIDHSFLWNKGYGRKLYYLMKFFAKTSFMLKLKKYDFIAGAGVVGNVVASQIARQVGKPFVYLGDEFPEIYSCPVWSEGEKEAVRNARLIIVPDENRIPELARQAKLKNSGNFFVLPNSPLVEEIIDTPVIDWHAKFKIEKNKKIILFGGSISHYTLFHEVLVNLPRWNNDFVLLINPNSQPSEEIAHLLIDGKVVWNSAALDGPLYYSLIKSSYASLGLYNSTVCGLEFTGKSSGKIMRSIACGTPVIASESTAMDFIREYNLGQLVDFPCYVPEALDRLKVDYDKLKENCTRAFAAKLSYNVYWKKFMESPGNVFVQ